MTFKEKYMADHPDQEWVSDLGPGCPSDHGYDTVVNEEKNCRSNGGEGCAFCWDRRMPDEPIAKIDEANETDGGIEIKGHKINFKYQERCSTRGDVRALYEKVRKDPHIQYYRGYTEKFSYGWNADADDYIRTEGVIWFENPNYIPEVNKPPVRTGDYIPDYVGPRILDSGNRRQFETGAVRDICEGKGRCDLLPLDVVGETMDNVVIKFIYQYQVEDGDYERLFDALIYAGIFPDLPTLMLEVAKHFEEGCKKYGDNNWQKGIPTHCYIDSAVRHYLKYLRGDKDEPHDRAFCWNILCCIWTCIHKPELNDYAPKEERK